MKPSATGIFAIVIGLFLLIEGIWGLSSPVVFEVLTTNRAHAIIHIILGILGLCLGITGHARGYSKFLGILLLAVGVLAFVPGRRELLAGLLNVNTAVACLNIAIGVVAFFVVSSDGQSGLAAQHEGNNATKTRRHKGLH